MTDTLPENEGESAPDPLAPDDDAPFGYTVDRATGERRAKKVPGRPKSGDGGEGVAPSGDSPPVESLPKVARKEDRAPTRTRAKRGGPFNRGDRKPKDVPEVPPFRAGPIAKGMNKLYFKAGKLIRAFDPEVGNAIISVTKKESEDDVTVGEAWEEIAKVNPRIRAFLLKMISGGAWSQLFMAHLPIFLALVMKPQVAKHIPFNNLVGAVLTDDDEGTPSEESRQLGGLRPDDVDQMMDFAQQMASQMGLGNLDLNAMMRGAGQTTEREPTAGGDQYGGFTPPEDGNAP